MLEECWMKVCVVCMSNPTCKSIYSFIWCKIIDGDRHAFSSDTIRVCWDIKWRHELGSFQNIIKKHIAGDQYAFKEMFRMNVEDFQTVLKHIDDLISRKEIQGGHRPVLPDERLALTLRFLATGESFQSLSFQFRIWRVAVSYIIKGYFDTIVERMVPIFISLPSSSDEWPKIAAKFENRI